MLRGPARSAGRRVLLAVLREGVSCYCDIQLCDVVCSVMAWLCGCLGWREE